MVLHHNQSTTVKQTPPLYNPLKTNLNYIHLGGHTHGQNKRQNRPHPNRRQ